MVHYCTVESKGRQIKVKVLGPKIMKDILKLIT